MIQYFDKEIQPPNLPKNIVIKAVRYIEICPEREASKKGFLQSLLSERFPSAFGIGWPVLSLIPRTREDQKVLFLQQPVKNQYLIILPLCVFPWTFKTLNMSLKKSQFPTLEFFMRLWPSEAVLADLQCTAVSGAFSPGAVFHHCRPAVDLVFS